MFALLFIFIATICVAYSGTIGPNQADLNNTMTGTCGGNCPSNTCTTCPCGSSSSYQSVSTWCSKYSGWNQAHCQCIMNAESGGNANAANQNTDGSLDVGLWQINKLNWASCSGGSAPCDTTTNLNCAKMIFGWGGNTWKYWSTCSKCGCCSSS